MAAYTEREISKSERLANRSPILLAVTHIDKALHQVCFLAVSLLPAAFVVLLLLFECLMNNES
jgi:hypothetical protein